jgi:hypothetical protein
VSARRYALVALEDIAARANSYASNSKSPATIRAYAAGWRDFLKFCPAARGRLRVTDRTRSVWLTVPCRQ